MPPKKTQKAIAAELKKKRAAEAEDIVAKLRVDSQKDFSSTSKTTKTVSSVSLKTFDLFEEDKRNRESTVDLTGSGKVTGKSTRKKTEKADGIVAKSQKPMNVPEKSSTAKATETAVKTISNSGDGSMSTSQRTKSASKITGEKSSVGSDTGSSNDAAYQYQYEIDCKRVADSIDVNDLQKHLEKHLKDYPPMEFSTPPLAMTHIMAPNGGGTLRRGMCVPPPDVTHHTNHSKAPHELHNNSSQNGSQGINNLSNMSQISNSAPKPPGILKDPNRKQHNNMQILNVQNAPGIGNSLLVGGYDPNTHNLSSFNASMGYTDADGHLV